MTRLFTNQPITPHLDSKGNLTAFTWGEQRHLLARIVQHWEIVILRAILHQALMAKAHRGFAAKVHQGRGAVEVGGVVWMQTCQFAAKVHQGMA